MLVSLTFNASELIILIQNKSFFIIIIFCIVYIETKGIFNIIRLVSQSCLMLTILIAIVLHRTQWLKDILCYTIIQVQSVRLDINCLLRDLEDTHLNLRFSIVSAFSRPVVHNRYDIVCTNSLRKFSQSIAILSSLQLIGNSYALRPCATEVNLTIVKATFGIQCVCSTVNLRVSLSIYCEGRSLNAESTVNQLNLIVSKSSLLILSQPSLIIYDNCIAIISNSIILLFLIQSKGQSAYNCFNIIINDSIEYDSELLVVFILLDANFIINLYYVTKGNFLVDGSDSSSSFLDSKVCLTIRRLIVDSQICISESFLGKGLNLIVTSIFRSSNCSISSRINELNFEVVINILLSIFKSFYICQSQTTPANFCRSWRSSSSIVNLLIIVTSINGEATLLDSIIKSCNSKRCCGIIVTTFYCRNISLVRTSKGISVFISSKVTISASHSPSIANSKVLISALSQSLKNYRIVFIGIVHILYSDTCRSMSSTIIGKVRSSLSESKIISSNSSLLNIQSRFYISYSIVITKLTISYISKGNRNSMSFFIF